MARVVMLLAGAWPTDSRVRREAKALAAAGHEVHVVSVAFALPAATSEAHEGVVFHGFPAASESQALVGLPTLAGVHARVVLAGLADELRRGRRGRAAAGFAAFVGRGLLVAAALPFFALAALLLFAARRLVRALGTGADARERRLDRLRGLDRFARARLQPLVYLNQFYLAGAGPAREQAPDVVHAHDLVTLSTGFTLARERRCALVYDAHELETHTNYWGLLPRTRRLMAVYERSLARRARAVVTVSDSIADWLRDAYSIERPVVVMNAPDVDAVEPEAAGAAGVRAAVGLAPEVPLAVYVGSVTADRGIEPSVAALAHLPRLHLALVGPRDPATQREALAVAERLGVAERLHLVDPVPSPRVPAFVASADCSLVPVQNVCLSYYFCFPNKLLESVLADLPVAAARLVEVERFVRRFGVGVVMDETDPAAIADAIAQILVAPARFRPGPEVLEAIRAEFGWKTQAARLVALYASLGNPRA